MTIAQMEARLSEISTELEGLDPEQLTEEQEARFDELASEANTLRTNIEKAESRAEARAKVADAASRGGTRPGADEGVRKDVSVNVRSADDPYGELRVSVFDGPEKMQSELRGRALRAVETTGNWELDDAGKEHVSNLLERKDDRQSTIARLVLATGSDAYKRAWSKAITGREMHLTDDERQALTRAASTTNAAGGFAIPFPIDPTLIHTGDGSTNPFRQVSRVEQITTDSWQGISAGDVSGSWDGEAAEVSDDTPTWAQPSVPVHKRQAFVPASIEIVQDYPGLAADLMALFRQEKDDAEAAAFATGSGTNQPTGIVTALTGKATASAAADTFAVGDVYGLLEALGPKYRSRASWVANLSIWNDIRQFGTSNNYHGFTVDLTEDYGFRLLGRPGFESSAMDGAINATVDNYVLVVGDFSNYLIADRVGATVEYIPHLFAVANNRPSGQRGWYMHYRVGADSVNDSAFELLNVT